MPRRIVTVRRWEVGFAILVLAAIFSVVLVWQGRIATVAHRTSARAETLSESNRKLLHIVIDNRRLTVTRIHAEQVRSCSSRHKLYVVLSATVKRGLASQKALLHTAIIQASPDLMRIQRQGLASSERTLRDLRGADCHGVPSVAIRPKPPKPNH